jgi:uncharacterized protein YukE
MGDAAFVSADTAKIQKFESDSADAIAEFNSIKDSFNSINSTLLEKWKGAGADRYKKESDNILENIGAIKDVLDSINNGIIKDVKENYNALDEELGTFNRNPQTSEEG